MEKASLKRRMCSFEYVVRKSATWLFCPIKNPSKRNNRDLVLPSRQQNAQIINSLLQEHLASFRKFRIFAVPSGKLLEYPSRLTPTLTQRLYITTASLRSSFSQNFHAHPTFFNFFSGIGYYKPVLTLRQVLKCGKEWWLNGEELLLEVGIMMTAETRFSPTETLFDTRERERERERERD